MKRILVIEDEKSLARFIQLELEHEIFYVETAYDGRSGLDLALQQEWDMILLDIMLPFVSGIEVCRQIRQQKKTPVIMLTARDTVTDRVSGLDSGADDYIPKPFAIEELLARMRALFRRVDMQDTSPQPHQTLAFRHLKVDVDARVVHKGNQLVDLTKREFDLLVMFMRNPNLVLTRDMLLDQVWGYDSLVETNVVDVYVRYLRNKLDEPGADSFIQTMRGIGYVMR
ncbi:response regulator transcription factor [Paenibacillus aestuarii]|uniref:Response regulator transcription factor n=1 Tax=Paenibacillus aestuarii TaxID=516965 RepID=A0ABW0K5D8_9BACL|nr:response regulator transcription factor [Paenibacillus aestuarii]